MSTHLNRKDIFFFKDAFFHRAHKGLILVVGRTSVANFCSLTDQAWIFWSAMLVFGMMADSQICELTMRPLKSYWVSTPCMCWSLCEGASFPDRSPVSTSSGDRNSDSVLGVVIMCPASQTWILIFLCCSVPQVLLCPNVALGNPAVGSIPGAWCNSLC